MKRLIYFVFLFCCFSSCQRYLDVNETPNNPLDVTPALMLPNTTVGMAWANSNALGRAASILVQYNAGLTGDPASFDVYSLEGFFDNQWNSEIYYGTINNLRILIRKTNGTSPAYSGIAKLQMAYVFSLATDL